MTDEEYVTMADAYGQASARRFLEKLGGSDTLWDSWCEFVASRRPASFPNGAREVSALHVAVLSTS